MSNESEINKFLNEDESKIKEALDHIQSELAKCTGRITQLTKKEHSKK
ncbi:Mlp lipoprotein family protein [Borrelia duttonii CR2A]|uniref:Mlp lipoprotein family protein n=1 Tax=Borrelia duttonii CR2A TaxID=1432657 RepID=W6TG16_9SPIR|nr:Mlp lipoprotein family protein [Borrelia duttonii CR2A]